MPRETPKGFVTLRDAADIVGCALIGEDWLPLTAEYIIKAKPDPKIELVITTIAEACVAGQLMATYESAGGGVDLSRAVWHRPHWRNYFVTGTIDQDLPLLDAGVPNKNGYTTRQTRRIFIRREELDELISEISKPRKKPQGRNPKHPWETWRQIFEGEREKRGDPRDADQMSGWNSMAAAAETLSISIGMTTRLTQKRLHGT